MSTNKLSHLKEWEKIYLEVTRKINEYYDDDASLFFESKEDEVCVSDDDTFYFPDELKKLANDGMPKQGEMIEVADGWYHWCTNYTFICMYGKKVLAIKNWEFETWDKWRFPKQKTEFTLAEVEEKLWLEKGSLIIKD